MLVLSVQEGIFRSWIAVEVLDELAGNQAASAVANQDDFPVTPVLQALHVLQQAGLPRNTWSCMSETRRSSMFSLTRYLPRNMWSCMFFAAGQGRNNAKNLP
jgi:hypothetical protein